MKMKIVNDVIETLRQCYAGDCDRCALEDIERQQCIPILLGIAADLLERSQKEIDQYKDQEMISKGVYEGQIKLSTAILAIENIKGNCGCPPDKDCAANQNCSLCYKEYLLSIEVNEDERNR